MALARRSIMVVALVLLAAALTAAAQGGVEIVGAAVGGSCMPRTEMLRRAATWVGTVAYSHELNKSFGYPTDCSGLVDWSANATKGGKPDNIKAYMFSSLRYATPVSKTQIAGGDILTHLVCKASAPPIRGFIGGHVIVFDKWADSEREQFWAFESSESFDQTPSCRSRAGPCYALHVLKNWTENGLRWGEIKCQSADFGNLSGGAHRALPSIICPPVAVLPPAPPPPSVQCSPTAHPPKPCPGGIQCPHCGKPLCDCLAPPVPPPPPPPTPHVGGIVLGTNETQLLVDDAIIESATNLTRTMNTPDAAAVAAILPDAPWEQGFAIGIIGTSVVVDPAWPAGRMRVYYQLRNASLGCGEGDQPPCSTNPKVPSPKQPNFETKSSGPILTAVAESNDGGRTFVKPLLHKYMLRNSTANNVLGIIFSRHGRKNKTTINDVFVDPTVPPGSPLRFRGVSGFTPFSSSDGLNWTMADKEWNVPPTPLDIGDFGSGGGDTQGVAFWDPPCGCYSFYTRFKNVAPRPKPWFRMVRRARAHDISNGSSAVWLNQSLVARADELDNHTHLAVDGKTTPPVDFYGATPWWSPRARMYFMAVERFWHWGLGGAHEPGGGHSMPGTKDVSLAYSLDGSNFFYLGGRDPFLRPTMDGTAGSRSVWLAPPGPIRIGDEELYFVTRSNVAEGTGLAIDAAASPHAWLSEIAVGRLRVDGLVSMNAGYSRARDAATLRTKPLIFHGRRLILNVDSSGGGSVAIQLVSAQNGKVLLTSVPISASGVHEEVLWGGSTTDPGNASALSQWAGVPVRLVMRLQECKLFSITVVA